MRTFFCENYFKTILLVGVMEIQLIVDVRERELLNCFAQTQNWGTGVVVVSEVLPIGDILLRRQNGEVILIIERKTMADLSASIRDGRYKEQSLRLQQSSGLPAHHIVYLIEGEAMSRRPATSGVPRMPSQQPLYSAFVSLFYYKGFSVMRTFHLEESAFFLVNMAKKIMLEDSKKQSPFYSNPTPIPIPTPIPTESDTTPAQIPSDTPSVQEYTSVAIHKIKKDNISRQNIWIIMLSQIPGITPGVCHALFAKFGGGMELLMQIQQADTRDNALKLFNGVMVNGRKMNRNCGEKLVEFFGKE